MGKMRKAEEQNQENDPYLGLILARWNEVVAVYDAFQSKTPILQINLADKKIYAYPFDEFTADLSLGDQTQTAKDRDAVLSGAKMLVFVRDEDQHKLVSYTFSR